MIKIRRENHKEQLNGSEREDYTCINKVCIPITSNTKPRVLSMGEIEV